MAILKNTTGWHGAASTKRGPEKRTGSVTIHSKSKSVELRFSKPASNGSTLIHVVIGEKDYEDVMQAMAKANREAALLAMATVLADHLTDMKKVRDEAEERDREERSLNLSSLSLPPKDGAAGP